MRRANLDVSFIQDESALETCFRVPGRILIYLLVHHNLKHGAYPGRRRISQDLGIDERSVRRALEDLKAADLIRRHDTGKGKTAHYYLPVNDQGYLQGGPDRWQYIEEQVGALTRHDESGKWAHPRPQVGASSSASGRIPVQQVGASTSAPLGALTRPVHSGDGDKKTSEHSMNTLVNTLKNTPKPGVCIHAPGVSPRGDSPHGEVSPLEDEVSCSGDRVSPGDDRGCRQETTDSRMPHAGARAHTPKEVTIEDTQEVPPPPAAEECINAPGAPEMPPWWESKKREYVASLGQSVSPEGVAAAQDETAAERRQA